MNRHRVSTAVRLLALVVLVSPLAASCGLSSATSGLHQATFFLARSEISSKVQGVASAWRSLLPRQLTEEITLGISPNAKFLLADNASNYWSQAANSSTLLPTTPWNPYVYFMVKGHKGLWSVRYKYQIPYPGNGFWMYGFQASPGYIGVISCSTNLSGDGYAGFTVSVDVLNASTGTANHVGTYYFGNGLQRPTERSQVVYLAGGYHAMAFSWKSSWKPSVRSYSANQFPLVAPMAGKPVFLDVISNYGQGPLEIPTVKGTYQDAFQSGNQFNIDVPAGSNIVFLPSADMSQSGPTAGSFWVYKGQQGSPPSPGNADSTWSEFTGPLAPGSYEYLLQYYLPVSLVTLSLYVFVYVH